MEQQKKTTAIEPITRCLHTCEYNDLKLTLTASGCRQVEAVPNSDVYATTLNTSTEVFCVDVQMDARLSVFCETLGQRLDYDPKKIVLWRSSSPSDRPSALMTREDFEKSTVHDLIASNGNFVHDPRW